MTAVPAASETAPSNEPTNTPPFQLRSVVDQLLADLKSGAGDRDKRKQVEEWMRSLAEKYPELSIKKGLRAYYLAEATRLQEEFEKTQDLTEKLAIGRSIEGFLDRASELGS
jgi:hypothetical protein